MVGKRNIRLPRLSGVALWAPIAGLMFLGCVTTLIDFFQLPPIEAARASAASQRFIINTETGDIALGEAHITADHEAAEQFDVATPEEADANPTPDTAEQHPAAETPTDAAAPTTTEPTPETAHDAAKEVKTEAHPSEPAKAEPATASTADAHPPDETLKTAETPKTEASADAQQPKPAAEPAKAAEAEKLQTAKTAAPATVDVPTPKDMQPLRTEPMLANLTVPPKTKDSLVGAPAPEVTETVDGISLPKRGGKGVVPSMIYAQPFTHKPDQVLISFVVMDVGIDPQSIGLAMALPKEISVAYSPYVRKEMSYSEHLRGLGHEVWTMLPTMNDRYPNDDPGPMGLISKMPKEEMLRRTRMVLSVIPGSVGVMLAPNEAISQQRNVLEPVLAEINSRGLLLLSTHPQRTLDQITTDKTLNPMLRRADLVLDPEPNETQIRSKLAGIVAAAIEKGEYLVVLSARPQSLQLLGEWLKASKLEAPVTLAPLSAMYQAKEAAEAPAEASGGGHGAKQEKPKAKPKPTDKKKQKPLPQDKYLKPGGKEGGGHGGGEKKSGGH